MSPTCPSEREWDELAAGLILGSAADRLLEHASGCANCAATLKAAIEVFAPEASVAVISPPAPRLWWIGAAIAAAALLMAGLWWRQASKPEPLTELARSYTSRRTIALRIPGAAHSPLRIDRSGTGPSLGNQPPELLEQAALIGRNLGEDPQSSLWIHAKGRLALIEWKPIEAIDALKTARDLGAAEPGISIDLASAYFERAEQRGPEGAADLTLAQGVPA